MFGTSDLYENFALDYEFFGLNGTPYLQFYRTSFEDSL